MEYFLFFAFESPNVGIHIFSIARQVFDIFI